MQVYGERFYHHSVTLIQVTNFKWANVNGMFENAATLSAHHKAQRMTNMGLWQTQITGIKATPVITVPLQTACLACRCRIVFALAKAMKSACVEHLLNIYFVGFALKNKTHESIVRSYIEQNIPQHGFHQMLDIAISFIYKIVQNLSQIVGNICCFMGALFGVAINKPTASVPFIAHFCRIIRTLVSCESRLICVKLWRQ